MENQNNEANQENTTFNDQSKSDANLSRAIQDGGTQGQQKLSKGVTSDDDENAGEVYSENLMGSPAEQQVRETEDASLQDDTYSFDEANTDNEEYHDASGGSDFDMDNDDDFIQ